MALDMAAPAPDEVDSDITSISAFGAAPGPEEVSMVSGGDSAPPGPEESGTPMSAASDDAAGPPGPDASDAPEAAESQTKRSPAKRKPSTPAAK